MKAAVIFHLGLGLPFLVSLLYAEVVTNIDQLDAAKNSPLITIKDLTVPAGRSVELLNLKPGTVVQFAGHIKFEHKWWKGTLIKITGKQIRIEGLPGNVIDGQGEQYWQAWRKNESLDRPRFMEVNVDDSVVTGLNFKNPPAWCFVANYCHNTFISNINVDSKAGAKWARNTDGISVGYGQNVTVVNSKVYNQDDCFVTGAGKEIIIDNLECTGGHGISIGSLGRGAVVENVLIKNSKVTKNMVGIRIKSGLNEQGVIRDITFDNIQLNGIHQYGIIVHGNYPYNGPPKEPTPFPIENINFRNIQGSVDRKGTNIMVWAASGASNWSWGQVNVTGGKREQPCKGIPAGLTIPCGKKG